MLVSIPLWPHHYPVMFHCLPLSSIINSIWFPQSNSFSPSILSQQFPDTIARHCHHHHTYMESIWCDYGIVEADSPFKLLPPSFLDIYKEFEHIDMLSVHHHQHMVGAIHSYTHTTWIRWGFWGSGSLVKWCHYIMVEADSHLKLLPPSILDIYIVFEHIEDMLFISIQ